MSISLDELQEKLQRTLALLKHRHPGLMTWNQLLSESLKDVKEILDEAYPSGSQNKVAPSLGSDPLIIDLPTDWQMVIIQRLQGRIRCHVCFGK